MFEDQLNNFNKNIYVISLEHSNQLNEKINEYLSWTKSAIYKQLMIELKLNEI